MKDDLPRYKISFSPYKFGGTIRLFLTTMVMSSEGFWNLTRNLSASHCMGITHWSTPICSFFHSLKTYSPFSDIIFTAKIICLLETICRIQRSTGSPPPIFRVTPFVSPSDNLHHRCGPKVGTFSTVRRYPCYCNLCFLSPPSWDHLLDCFLTLATFRFLAWLSTISQFSGYTQNKGEQAIHTKNKPTSTYTKQEIVISFFVISEEGNSFPIFGN